MRTDRTFVCTQCRIRCWPVRHCPACGESRALVDLARDPGAIERGPAPSGSWGLTSVFATAAVVAGGALGWSLTTGVLALAEVAALVAIPSTIVAFVAAPRGGTTAGVTSLPFQVLASPVVRASAERASYRGPVRAKSTLIAPLSRKPCVAWRVVGDGPFGPIDDGRSVPFAVLQDRGRGDVEVDATIATLELLALEQAPRAPELDRELEAWLRARGVPHGAALLELREALIVEGDEVEVEGSTTTQTRADGYRGSTARQVLADVPGSPLIVRCPPPATVETPTDPETAASIA